MHLRHLWIGLAVALSLGAVVRAATVYKWTDSNGVVHYSDQPAPGAQRIETQSAPEPAPHTTAPAPIPYAKRNRTPDETDQARKTSLDYEQFAIDMPQPEQNFTEMTIPVRIRLEPALRNSHMISLYLDGKQVAGMPDTATEFTLTDVPRGAHTVVAMITDADSNQSKTTQGVTFYVQRPSLLSPLRKKK